MPTQASRTMCRARRGTARVRAQRHPGPRVGGIASGDSGHASSPREPRIPPGGLLSEGLPAAAEQAKVLTSLRLATSSYRLPFGSDDTDVLRARQRRPGGMRPGSAIKRVTEYLNPRVARIVALPAPTERERGQWYFQRYVAHLPAAGEIVLMDRSWYNRAGVERVMGFCTQGEYRRFLRQCPVFERLLIEDGILLRKYWFSVSDAEQERRFRSRLDDPMRRWKLSPMDVESIMRWQDYSRAKDEMFVHTDIRVAPGTWWRPRTSAGRAST